MSAEAILLLKTVAQSFLDQDKPLQAIRCLEALCLAPRSDYPELEAGLHYELGRLLLQHTHSLDKAIHHLNRANFILSKARDHHGLKAAVLSLLAQCHHLCGAQKLEQDCLKKGLSLLKKAPPTIDKKEMLHWKLHFLTALAASHTDPEQTLKALQQTLSEVDDLSLTVDLKLSLVQHHLSHSQSKEAREALEEASELLARAKNGATGNAARLQLQYEVLKACLDVGEGNIEAVASIDEGQSSFPKMVGSLVDAAEQETDGKDTVSFRLLAATAFLVAAASWQPRGRFSKAKALLATAMSHLHLAAKDLAVDLEAEERSLAPVQKLPATQLARLESLILEASAIGALSRNDLIPAGHFILEIVTLTERRPSIRGQTESSIHLLAGHYCCRVGNHKLAVEHFVRAAQTANGKESTKFLAAAEAIATLLDVEGSASIPQALNIMREFNLEVRDDQNPLSRTLCQYAKGRVQIAQGETEPREIMIALKAAHKPMSNNQFVASMMLALVPGIMTAGDMMSANTMATSALLLAKGIQDPVLQIAASEQSLEWMTRTKATEDIPKQEEYLLKKRKLLEQEIEKAVKSPQHAAILSCKEA